MWSTRSALNWEAQIGPRVSKRAIKKSKHIFVRVATDWRSVGTRMRRLAIAPHCALVARAGVHPRHERVRAPRARCFGAMESDRGRQGGARTRAPPLALGLRPWVLGLGPRERNARARARVRLADARAKPPTIRRRPKRRKGPQCPITCACAGPRHVRRTHTACAQPMGATVACGRSVRPLRMHAGPRPAMARARVRSACARACPLLGARPRAHSFDRAATCAI